MTRPTAPDAELIDAKAVARLLSCSHRMVALFESRGVLPRGIRLAARCVRWRRSDVLAAIERLHAAAQEGGAG